MIQSLDVPVVSLAVPNIHKMDEITSDDLSCMWTVFTKCKDNLENGRRLENLSWRLWYRESLIEKAQEEHVRTPIPIHQSNNNNNNNINDDNDYFSYASASTCDSTPLQTPRSLKHMSPSSFKRMISSLDNNSIEKQHYLHQQQSAIQLLPTPKLTPSSPPPPQQQQSISNSNVTLLPSTVTSSSKIDSQPTTTTTTKNTVASLTVVAPQPKKAFSVPKPQRKFFVSDDEESSDDENDDDDDDHHYHKDQMAMQNSYNNNNKDRIEDDNDDGCWSTVRTTDDRHFYSSPPPSCSTKAGNKITFSSAPTASETDFIKKTPTFIAKQHQPQPSLLSAMLTGQRQQQQRRKSSVRKNHQYQYQQRRQRSINNNTINQEEMDLSQSLKYCVDWEQRQNAIDIDLTTQHHHPYQIQQRKSLEVYSNNNYCWESFRGW